MSDPSLFEIKASVYRDVPIGEHAGRSRQSDPDTSQEAACQVDVMAIRAAILTEFAAFGWLTDDELCGLLSHLVAASVKTARSGLKRDGFLADSGTRRPSNHGRPMIVWCLRG